MVRSALSSNPHQHLHLWQFQDVSILEVRRERLQHFKSLRIFANDDFSLGLRFWHRPWLIRSITGCEARRRKVLSRRRLELERLPGRQRQRVSHGVEGKPSRECHCGHYRGRSEEIHRKAITVISRLEVAKSKCKPSPLRERESIPVEGSQNRFVRVNTYSKGRAYDTPLAPSFVSSRFHCEDENINT